MSLYLSSYIGKGTKADPFRPAGFFEPGASTIDIRLDPTKLDGDGIPYALLWLPADIPAPRGVEKLADDYGEPVTELIKTLSNTKLGLDFSKDTTIQDVVETVLFRPDTGRWKSVRPSKGIYEVWLGSSTGKQKWVELPVIAGGSISDSFTRANEVPVAAPWTELAGSVGNTELISNALTKTTVTVDDQFFMYYSNGAGWNADQSCQFTYASAISTSDWGPAVRVGSNGFSAYWYSQYSGGREIGKWVAGVYSSVEAASGATSVGTAYKIDATGSTIRYYDGGAENANSPATDTSLSTAGNGPGFWRWVCDSGSIDDFVATGELGGGGSAPLFRGS